MTEKVALITGVTGQDGAYLAELLLDKGYRRPRHQAPLVVVQHRRGSITSTRTRTSKSLRFFLHYGDLTDATNLIRIVQETQPRRDLQSRRAKPRAVSASRRRNTPPMPTRSARCGCWRRSASCGLEDKARFYQASTSELYGKVQEVPQSETTPFYPRSPYAAAKLYAYWITVNYREAYGMHASNGILFNHEGPTRGETFVTRKITRAVAAIELGPAGEALSRQSRCQARLGPRPRLRRGHVADAAAARSPTIMCWRPAKPTRCASSSSGPSPDRRHADRMARQGRRRRTASTPAPAACWSRSIRAISGRPKSNMLLGDPSKAQAEARLDATASPSRAGAGDGRRTICAICADTELAVAIAIERHDDPPLLFDLAGQARLGCSAIAAWSGGAIVRRLGHRRLRDRSPPIARRVDLRARSRPRPGRAHHSPTPCFSPRRQVGGIHRQRHVSGGFHPRQSGDRAQRHARRAAGGREEAAVSRLVLHLSANSRRSR